MDKNMDLGQRLEEVYSKYRDAQSTIYSMRAREEELVRALEQTKRINDHCVTEIERMKIEVERLKNIIIVLSAKLTGVSCVDSGLPTLMRPDYADDEQRFLGFDSYYQSTNNGVLNGATMKSHSNLMSFLQTSDDARHSPPRSLMSLAVSPDFDKIPGSLGGGNIHPPQRFPSFAYNQGHTSWNYGSFDKAIPIPVSPVPVVAHKLKEDKEDILVDLPCEKSSDLSNCSASQDSVEIDAHVSETKSLERKQSDSKVPKENRYGSFLEALLSVPDPNNNKNVNSSMFPAPSKTIPIPNEIDIPGKWHEKRSRRRGGSNRAERERDKAKTSSVENVADRKVYGSFLCQKCKAKWGSSQSVLNQPQTCRYCKTVVQPYSQGPILSRRQLEITKQEPGAATVAKKK